MTKIINDIQEAIAKNLPAAVGAELQKQLVLGENAIAKNVSYENELNEKEAEIKSLRKDLAKHAALDIREAAIDKVEKELAVGQAAMQVEKLAHQLEVQQEKTKFVTEVAMGLVRNTEYRKTVFDSEINNVPYMGPGGYQTTTTVNNSKSLTETSSTA